MFGAQKEQSVLEIKPPTLPIKTTMWFIATSGRDSELFCAMDSSGSLVKPMDPF